MTQTKKQSAIEAAANILVGVFYTVVSFARSYGLRRFYNWWHK